MALTAGQQQCLEYVRARQREGLRAYVLWAGSIRAGKTTGACMALVEHLLYHGEPAYYILSGASVRTVTHNVAPVMLRTLRDAGIPHKHYRSFANPRIVAGKAEFLIYGADDASSELLIQGLTAHGMLVDELTNVNPSFVRQAEARCSAPAACRIVTMNKLSQYHWSATDYYHPMANGEIEGLLIDSHINENIFLDQSFVTERRQEYSGADLARKIENEFAGAGHLVFPDYSTYHPTPGVADAAALQAVIGVDWGPAGYTAALRAERREGNIVVCREYYHNGRNDGILTEAEHYQAIVKAGLTSGNVAWAIDPRATILREIVRRNGGRLLSWNAPQVADAIGPMQTALRTGRWKISTSCPALLSQLENYAFKEGSDMPNQTFDDSVDALRYLFAAIEMPRMVTTGGYLV